MFFRSLAILLPFLRRASQADLYGAIARPARNNGRNSKDCLPYAYKNKSR